MALADAISNLSFTRDGLLDLLALKNAQLLLAAKVKHPDSVLRDLELPRPTKSVPTAL